MRCRSVGLAAAVLCLCPAVGRAQTGSVPQLDSRPGAAYTLYLNFGGFNYTGTWGNTGRTPGVVPAYDTNGDATTFSAAEVGNIKDVWSRVAEKFAAFNINVTTVDPAPAGATAAARQSYYESTPRVMQTIIGGSNAWYSSSAGGVSYLGVAYNGGTPSGNGGAGAGYKTNWAFSDNLGNGYPMYVAEAVAHEDGHALGLQHQARWHGAAIQGGYDQGEDTGYAIAPIMGVGYYATRSTWRVGTTDSNGSVTAQNDVKVIQANNGIRAATPTGFVASGVGQSAADATPLPLTGTAINSAAAKGLITPLSSTDPNPIGEANYTADFFTFTVAAGQLSTLSVTLRSGRSTITSGEADPGATLNATLRLLDANGNVIATADTGLFVETLTASSLADGTYYLKVSSAGGFTDVNGNTYFDTGSYFLTGTLTPVPEPGCVLAVSALAAVAIRRRTRRAEPARTEDHACPSKS